MYLQYNTTLFMMELAPCSIFCFQKLVFFNHVQQTLRLGPFDPYVSN